MRQARALLARSPLALVLVLALSGAPAAARAAARAEEPVDWEAVNRIRNEGFHNSRVMETARELTEGVGPRLTGSPGMRRANEWTRDRLAEWGLAGARLEPWGPFGRGWSFDRVAVHLVEPFAMPLVALPEAWTPGTGGPVRGELVRVTLESEEDFEQHRGTLAGKVLLLDDARPLGGLEAPAPDRYGPEALERLEQFEIPAEDGPPWRQRALERWRLRRALNELLVEEGVVATVRVSSRDDGIVRVGGGGSREPGESPGVPGLVMAFEHYNRLVRLGEGAVIEIDVTARFHDEDPMAYNTLAEIPGTDLAHEVVMVGAHLDSWHGGTGASDNAAGCAIAMEAVRILVAAGLEPRRTIRIALWSGEEQGLLGSRAYVAEHFASRAAAEEAEDPEERDLPEHLRERRGPLTIEPAHARLSAYFNLDNGGGRIRGIYAQENAAAAPIFRAWLAPLHDLGARTVTLNNTGGTDHLSFDRVGLPGFQFVQDMGGYMLVHHGSSDTFDRLSREDLMQASVVVAAFLHHAATRDGLLPRKPLLKDEPAGE